MSTEKPSKRISDREWLLISYSFGCQWLLVFSAFFSIDGQNVLMHYALICFEPFLFSYIIYCALNGGEGRLSRAIIRANIFVVLLFFLTFVSDALLYKEMPGLKGRFHLDAAPKQTPK
jgi:hypothetical protein